MSGRALVVLQPVAVLTVHAEGEPRALMASQPMAVMRTVTEQGPAGRDGILTVAETQALIDTRLQSVADDALLYALILG